MNRERLDQIAEENARRLADAVHDRIIQSYERERDAIERAEKTRDEVKAELVNEFAEENAMLRDDLRLSVARLSSEKELDAYTQFVEKHSECRMRSIADGGKMPYVTQIGTGVGTCTKVHCQVCGESEDITDISVW